MLLITVHCFCQFFQLHTISATTHNFLNLLLERLAANYYENSSISPKYCIVHLFYEPRRIARGKYRLEYPVGTMETTNYQVQSDIQHKLNIFQKQSCQLHRFWAITLQIMSAGRAVRLVELFLLDDFNGSGFQLYAGLQVLLQVINPLGHAV